MVTLAELKAGARIGKPIYLAKSYVVLSKEGMVLSAGTLDEVKARNYGGYYDNCEVKVREHDLYLNDNTKIQTDYTLALHATPDEFLEFCKRFDITVARNEDGMVTLEKSFTPDNPSQYATAEAVVFQAMMSVPQTAAGSIWGTTSDGVGGYSGQLHGKMVLNKSGVSKRWQAKLNKTVIEAGL